MEKKSSCLRERSYYLPMVICLFLALGKATGSLAQQMMWAKLYPLPKMDAISCITKDEFGNLYAGGFTRRNLVGTGQGNAILYKMDSNGDTLYTKFLGIKGDARSIVLDQEGMVRIAVSQYGQGAGQFNTIFLKMTPEGFIYKRDTVYKYLLVNSAIMGRDSSWILVGRTSSLVTGGWEDMFFQRIQKDGTIDPYIPLNPNHPDCAAHRVEQLPNGKYLVSGHVGSRILAYTLDPDGGNPQYEVWYQTPDLSYLSLGHLGQAKDKKFVLGAQGSPSIAGLYDSLQNKIWIKKDTGQQIAPQAMTDGSILLGYSQRPKSPTHTFARIGEDSSIIWFLNLRDSLQERGMLGNLFLKAYTYFEDQSAIVAAQIYQSGATDFDPLFLKISNVGTPVTSLVKPKKGPLANETLAPWPNPTGGTLYLKQHFDRAEIHLYNMSGREVGSYRICFAQPIDVSDYKAGIYLYRAVIDGKLYSGKIIKQ